MEFEFNIDAPFEKMIIRFLNGQLSVEETAKLNEWVEESPENQKIFRAYQNIWLGTSESLSDEKRFNPTQAWRRVSQHIHNLPDRQKQQARSKTRRIYIGLAKIAALVAIFFTVGAMVSYLLTSHYQGVAVNEGSYEISVPQGAKTKIMLPDSSTVWLNAGSTMIYNINFNQNERIIQLEGEAYFDVTSNPTKPFVVKTAHLDVRAIGTSFNVKAYPEENTISATLVEGNVVVEIPYLNDRILKYNLEPKQNFTYDILDRRVASEEVAKTDEPLKDILAENVLIKIPQITRPKILLQNNVRPELYTSWKDDVWIIEGETMNDMALMLGRRYNTDINIQTDELKPYRFTGKIMNETLEQVLNILEMTTPLKYSVGIGYVNWDIDPNHKDKFDVLINSNNI